MSVTSGGGGHTDLCIWLNFFIICKYNDNIFKSNKLYIVCKYSFFISVNIARICI